MQTKSHFFKISYLFLAILFFAVSLTTSCGTKKGSTVKLKFSTWSDQRASVVNKLLIRRFMEQNPGIEVILEELPFAEYEGGIIRNFATGTAPDVFMAADFMITQLIKKEALLPLDELKNDPLFTTLHPKAKEKCVYGDVLYGLPRNFGSYGMYYNKDIFNKLGIELPTDNWNWDTLVNTGKKLSDLKTPQLKRFALAGVNPTMFLYQNEAKMWSSDYKRIQKEDVGTMGGFEFYKKIVTEYKLVPSTLERNEQNDSERFIAEGTALLYSGNWDIFKLMNIKNFEWGVTLVPGGKRKGTRTGGGTWVINRDTKQKENAIKFLKFLSSEESISLLIKRGDCVPFRNNENEINAFKSIPPLLEKNMVFYRALDYSYNEVNEFGHPEIPFYMIAKIMADEVDLFLLGKNNYEQTIDSMNVALSRITQ